jgi:hypothetical protein
VVGAIARAKAEAMKHRNVTKQVEGLYKPIGIKGIHDYRPDMETVAGLLKNFLHRERGDSGERFARRYAAKGWNGEHEIKEDQGDGFKITTPYGYIQYRPVKNEDTNEIWWVESHLPTHGMDLVDLMQKHHPASAIAWGALSSSGRGLMERWHDAHPEVQKVDSGPFEGQFDTFGHDEENVDDGEDFEEEE